MAKVKNIPVSVIMSEYSTNPVYLDASLKSILNQTHTNFELILVDDRGSNDVEKLIKSYNDPRIRVIKNPKNMGLVASLNRALQESRSEFVVRMDTDDIAHPERIETLVDYITQRPEYSVVGSRVSEFSGKKKIGILGKSGEKGKNEIASGDVPVHPSAIMNKADVLRVGGYPDYKRAEDLALWCELLLAGHRLYVIDDILLDYRVNPEDYSKRTLKTRSGEIRARLHYYSRLKVSPLCYIRIVKSVVAGVMPMRLVGFYRTRIVLKNREDYDDHDA